ncbi:MAG: uracil phosphoribosyltransferase [Proteobacteria bacterium]|jgi:pyrimidine operon attenuation protein/uracil phosphoribosyltransferase|nr:uracil phosphoribosyltransferase [Pseudomonadota bacterium]MBS1224490.1 uracil phosphoribosyltransferase [Pseudomonadota bacterium]
MRDAEPLIETMAGQLRELLAERDITEPMLVGIHTGGVWIAERLRQLLGIAAPLGQLDISFYRDDFNRIGVNRRVRPSELPFDVDGRHLVLVDDVLNTGRTIRAALNELFDYGRPASVLLAVLVDRGGRELPIEAQVVGARLKVPVDQEVQLTGPELLQLVIQQITP